MDYCVSFTMTNGSTFSREVSADDVADAAFIGTLDLVYAVDQWKRTDLLEKSDWTTSQALALQVTRVTVKAF